MIYTQQQCDEVTLIQSDGGLRRVQEFSKMFPILWRYLESFLLSSHRGVHGVHCINTVNVLYKRAYEDVRYRENLITIDESILAHFKAMMKEAERN